jgi:putative tricarboxylic transport membrane protein
MMRRYGLPILPLVLGVILGPRLEKQLRTSLQLSEGHVSGLFSEPVALVVYAIVALVLLWPLVARLTRLARRDRRTPATPATDPLEEREKVEIR